LSGAIAYQVLQQENPQPIEKVKAGLRSIPGMRTSGRQGCKMFLLPITASCCLCRRQGGLTTFAATKSSSTVRCGTTSTGPLSPMDNHQAYKPESLSR